MTDQPDFAQGIFQGEVLARLKAIESTCEQIRLLSHSYDDRLRVVEIEQESCIEAKGKLIEQEKRLRVVEDSQTRLKAYATALGAVAGFIGSFIKKLW